jgi:hypothetical protein
VEVLTFTTHQTSSPDEKKQFASDDISSILAKYPLIHSVDELTIQANQELKNLWQVGVVENQKVLVIPNNLSDVIKNNYLINLYVNFCLSQGFTFKILEKSYTSRLLLETSNLFYLKAFGLAITEEQFPKFPQNHNSVWKGLAGAAYIHMTGLHGVQSELFKFSDQAHPNQVIFGDVWGKAYPIEKQMLDRMIHHLKIKKFEGLDYSFWLKQIGQIKKEKGLDIDLTSQVLSDFEKNAVELLFEEKEEKIHWDFDIPSMKTVEEILSFQRMIQDRQKSVRDYKRILNEIIGSRVSACYSSYKGKQKEKIKKTPIRDLINPLKGTSSYGSFNPSLIFKIKKITPIQPVHYSNSEQGDNDFTRDVVRFEKNLHDNRVNNSVIISFRQEWVSFLKEYFSNE